MKITIGKYSKFFVIVLSGFILVSVIGLFLTKNDKKSFQSSKGIHKLITTNSSEFKYDEKLKNSNITVRISYPLIESGLSPLVISSFNEYLRSFTAGVLDEYRDWFNDMDAVPPNRESNTLPESSINGDYEVIRADENLISVRFRLIRSWGSMAHPYEFTKVVNYSVRDNKNLFLSDLFRKDSNYLDTLADLAKQKIIDEYKKDGVWDEELMEFVNVGTKPEGNSFKKFVIGEDFLLFIFDPYEVGPYATGTREARILFTEFGNYLDKSYL